MRTIYNLLVGLFLLSSIAYAQNPVIQVDPAVITTSIATGTTKTLSIKIQNTGSRELDWSFNGAMVYFSKIDFANILLAANQDRINNNVWLVRADSKGIFNIKSENSYDNNDYTSPLGTEWFKGSGLDAGVKQYADWRDVIPWPIRDNVLVGTYNMHSIVDNEYYDFNFETWTASGMGGGYSYKRYRVYPWMTATARSGQVVPADSASLDVTIDATNLTAGTYNVTMYIYSNDPVTPAKALPFAITVYDAPAISVSPTSIDFGSRTVGSTKVLSLQLNNAGAAPLLISNITSSETEFAVPVTSLTIPAKSSYLLPVTFIPSAIETTNANLTITSNADGSPTSIITLTGIGVGAPDISLNAFPTNFNLNAGSTLLDTLVISNLGAYDLNWAVSVKPIKSGGKLTFVKPNNANYLLPQFQDKITNDVILVRDDNAGLFNLAVESKYDRPGWTNPPQPTGTLWASDYAVNRNSVDYSTWYSAARSWGSTYDMVGHPMSIYLANENKYVDIVFHSWTSGNQGGGYSYTRDSIPFAWAQFLSASGSGTLAASGSQEVIVSLDATDLVGGVYNAILEITSNDPDQEVIQLPIQLTVSGNPTIAINNLDFGTVFTNDSSTVNLEVFNNGNDDLIVSSFSSDNAEFKVATQSFVVKPNKKGIIPVQYKPAGVGASAAILTVLSNDTVNPSLTVNLTGTGALPASVEFSKDTIVITVPSGLTASNDISVKNIGNSDLVWNVSLTPQKSASKITFTKADYADFLLSQNHDTISDDVIFARGINGGIFNLAVEEEYQKWGWMNPPQPTGTIWANDSTFNKDLPDYTTWHDAVRSFGNTYDAVGHPMSVYLQNENKFIDLTFTSWTSNGDGGGYSYIRDAVPFHSNYVSADILNDTDVPSDSTIITFTADATNIFKGTYFYTARFITNDPDNRSVVVPIKVIVTGFPVIHADTLDVNKVALNSTKNIDLVITNTGADVLQISSYSINNTAFTVNSQTLTILPHKTTIIPVTYMPVASGLDTALLTINSNDIVNPVYTVVIFSEGSLGAQLVVNADTIRSTVAAGDNDVISLSVKNSGEISLIGNLAVAISDQVHFQKTPYADWTKAENQDRITDHVWITRGNTRGIFNIKQEVMYDWSMWPSISPKGTVWAEGRSVDLTPGDYKFWREAMQGNNNNLVGHTYSMFDQTENRFFDITFESWSEGDGNYNGSGGGVSYTRVEVPFWVNTISNLDTVANGDSTAISFTLDATNLVAGVYNSRIYFNTNDLDKPTVMIPIKFTVTGMPVINTSGDVVFDDQPLGGLNTKTITIQNTGTDVLTISSITNDSAVFTPAQTTLSVNAGATVDLQIAFEPTDAILYQDTLVLVTNDTANLIVKIALTGSGLQPPTVVVSKTMIDEKTTPGSTVNVQLVVKNNGASALNWTLEGQSVTFTKVDNADYTLAANQDRISDNVWITRKSSQAIFNIKSETGYVSTSPAGTQWAYGTTASNPTYKNWFLAVNGDPQGMLGNVMSLYLPNDNRYFDIVFSSYSGGGIGGGFAYTRTEILPDWINFSATSSSTPAADSTILDVELDASGLNGTYNTVFVFKTNDPTTPVVTVPVTFTVGEVFVNNPVADVRLNQGFATHKINLADVFDSPVAYTIQAISNKTSVVTTSIVGDSLIITEVGAGSAVITLRADDGLGHFAYDDFTFIVNAAPIVANPVANVIKNVGFSSQTIDLTNTFTDINGDALTINVGVENPAIATVAIVGKTLTITEVGPGLTNIYLSATDGFALTNAADTFTVKINTLPTADAGIDQIICEGETVSLTASGGLTYAWSTLETGASINVAPVVTTTYTVTLTDINGNTDDDQIVVTVKAKPDAQIAGDLSICVGTSTYLIASGGDTFEWSTISSNDTINVSVADTYTVTVTTNGCSDVASATLVVNSLPTANAGADKNICTYNTASLTATGAVSYVWNTTDTTASITVNPAVNTYYTVTATDANGCTDDDIVYVKVLALASATAGSNQTICSGASASLTASGAQSFLWSNGANTAITSVSPSVTTTFTVTVTNTIGCTDTKSVVVNVNTTPTANISGTTTICAGEQAVLVANGGDTYAWNDASTNDSLLVNTADTYSVTVTSNGCSDEASVSVSVNSLPTATISGVTSICAGTSTNLIASGGDTFEWNTTSSNDTINVSVADTYTVTVTTNGCSDVASATLVVNSLPTANAGADQNICFYNSASLTGSGGVSYAWNTGGTSASITVSPTAHTSYTLTVTDANGCTDDDVVYIKVLALAAATAGNDVTICAGNSTSLTASGAKGYLWNTGDTTTTISVSPAITTTYVLTVTNTIGCTDTRSVVVTVNALPTAAISGSNTFCDGANTTLVASGGTSYLWNDNTTDASLVVSTAGTFTVTVTENGCSDTASANVTIDLCTAILTKHLNSVSLYPNPVSSTLSISFGDAALYRLELTNMLGQVQLSKTLHSYNGMIEQIDMSQLATGMYLVKLHNGTSISINKINKE